VIDLIKREEYLGKIRPFINRPVIKVLTGIRRCGKSVMLELIIEELLAMQVSMDQIVSINFESGRWEAGSTTADLYQLISKKSEIKKRLYLFFDEIQELDGWEKTVNACLIDFDVDIYLTGSNAKLLSGELATYLGGRYVEFKIYPFSFGEIRQAQIQNGDPISEPDSFMKYLRIGGMPVLYQFPFDDQSAKMYLSDIYASIILKDIAERNQVRDIELLKRVLMFLIVNIGNLFSAASIIKYLKNERRTISQETLYNYIDYSKSACFAHLVPREDVIGKQVLSFHEKIYLADHGFRESLYGNNERDINQVLENIVFMELLRRGYKVHVGKNDKKEVDLVAEKPDARIYIQVAYLLASDETMEREFSALESIPDNYPKYVITMDEINRSRKGIKHLNIRKFLLDQSLLS
jgi:predicted AAA+ superfamily ATPase